MAAPNISRLLYLLAIAAAAVSATGCASTPQDASAHAPSAASAAQAASQESPASASKLVQTADFAAKAERDGWEAQVRNGQMIYCKTEMPINSRLPKRTCLNRVGVEQMMLAEEHQREEMQRPGAAPCLQAGSC